MEKNETNISYKEAAIQRSANRIQSHRNIAIFLTLFHLMMNSIVIKEGIHVLHDSSSKVYRNEKLVRSSILELVGNGINRDIDYFIKHHLKT